LNRGSWVRLLGRPTSVWYRLNVGGTVASSIALTSLLFLMACVTKPLHERDWVEVRTPHFEIVSSLGEDATRELAWDAEIFVAATEFVMGTPLRTPAVPTRIYAFDGRGFRRPFAVRGAPSSFLPSLRESVIVLRTGGGWQADTTQSLRREYVHYLLRNHGGFELPLWFDEGSAEFLSTVEVKGNHGELGGVRQDHLRLLRGQPWVPLIRILRAEELEGWGNRKRAIFCAESWAFVHYLNFGLEKPGQGQAQLGRYFRSLADGAPHERAVEKAFGMSSSSLDRRLQDYVRGERFGAVAIRFEHSEAVEAAEPRPLARDEVVTRLGWLLISLGRAKPAQRFFERAIAANPNNARAHAGLGAADDLRGDWEAAIPHFRRALGIAPDDPLNQLDAGAHYYARARQAPNAEARAQLAQLARSHYARSQELDDSLPEAYAMYGATFLLDGEETQRGLEPLEHASQMLPSSMEIKLLLARLYARLGRSIAARSLAVAISSRTHSEAIRADAQQILAEGHGPTTRAAGSNTP
jgi:tetratricopeptide (TPR) repeat protein